MPDKKESPFEYSAADILASMFLKDFILAGYPALDPAKQVDAAYQYAELMLARRKENA